MSKKYLPTIIFVVIALVLVAVITFATSSGSKQVYPQPGNTNSNSSTSTVSTGTTPTSTAQTYTLADVTKHATQADCWTTVNGSVYNVTSWIAKHPGGAQAIIGLCGIDGSDAFNGQHGGQRRPANELASFKIGTLAQ